MLRTWVLGCLAGLWLVGAVHAQDMRFGLEDSVGPAPDARGAPPSEALVRALAHYDAERFEQAAVQLERVVEGGTSDGAANLERAQFYLAKALFHLGFRHSALGVFDEISRKGAQHGYFAESLRWIVQLAEEAPQPRAALELLGRYDASLFEPLASSLAGDARARLLLLRGQDAYAQGELERAIALLSQIEGGSEAALRARFLLGVAEVRLHRAQPAIRAFREIVRIVDEGQSEGGAAADRMRELAWLSLGRVYYTAAHQLSDPARQGALIGNAVEAWSRVDSSSEYWLDALFESAWALFVSDEHARALGNLHALLSPYFTGAFYPEAHLLKAVIFFNSCQMDNAMAAVEQLRRDYDPLRTELEALLARESDPARFQALVAEPDRGMGALSPRLRAILTRVLGDREVARARGEIEAVAREQVLLEHASKALRESSLAARIRQDLELAASFAKSEAGELARARGVRLLGELQEVANQADTVEIEVLNYQRGRIGQKPNTPSPLGRSVRVDSEHVIWPFNGEYWRDELGYYRQQLSSACDAR